MRYLNEIDFIIETKKELKDSSLFHTVIKIPMDIGYIERVKIMIESSNNTHTIDLHHTRNDGDYAYFEGDFELPTRAIYHFYFTFEANNHFYYYKKNNLEDNYKVSKEDMWKLSSGFSVPDWAKGKIMYHIFLDRFNRGSNEPLTEMPNRTIHSSWDEDITVGPNEQGKWNADFYGGDLKGITEKLNYLQSLGVTIIYISPICWSQSNHRYDTSDYEQVDPYAGTNRDLKELCDKAHSMGMKVILDAVFNHTGNDSKYFNEYNSFDELGAYQSKDSKYYSFYRSYVNNNQTFFDYWWGMKNLPVCDGNSKTWQEYIYGEGGIIDLWFSLGIDGLRLDVADELTDSFIEGIREAVKRNKEDGFIIGEVWKNPMRMGRSYIESGKGMDTVMNYTLIDALIRYFKYSDKDKLREVFHQLITEYPTDTLNSLMNFTSTHDISRVINIFGTKEFQYSGEWAWNLNNNDLYWQKDYRLTPEEYELGKEILKAYVSTLAFLPGNLSIFYGDEVGLQGMGNLANRRTFPWNREDLELLEFYRQLLTIRSKEEMLKEADLDIIDINEKYLLFKRTTPLEEILVATNRSNDNQRISLPTIDYKELYKLGNSNNEELSSHGVLVLKKYK